VSTVKLSIYALPPSHPLSLEVNNNVIVGAAVGMNAQYGSEYT